MTRKTYIYILLLLSSAAESSESETFENPQLLLANNEKKDFVISKNDSRMNIIGYTQYAIVNSAVLSNSAYAKQLAPEKHKVTIEIPGVAEGEFIGNISRFRFELLQADDFISFLDLNRIKDPELITNALVEGMDSDGTCSGLKSECVVTTSAFSIVIDYYNKKIRLFISSDRVGENKVTDNYLSLEGDNILKNKTTSYYSSNGAYENFYINNKGYAGFYDGYVYYNTEITEANNTVYDASYTWLNDSKKVQIGRVTRGQPFNYAYSRSYVRSEQFQGILIGLSDQLNLNSTKKTYSFYSPLPATIIVSRDGKEIYKRYVSAGIGNIEYKDLPSGNYQADIKILSDSGTELYQSTAFFANSGVAGDKFDFYLQYGYLDDNKLIYAGGVSVPLMEHFTATASLQNIDSINYITTGVEYRFDPFVLTGTITESNAKSQYNMTAIWGDFSVNYLYREALPELAYKIKAPELDYNIKIPERSFVMNYNHKLGNGILNYSYSNNSFSDTSYKGFGIVYMTPIYNNLYLSTGYERVNNDNIFNLSVSIPLGKKVTSVMTSRYANGRSDRVDGQYRDNITNDISYHVGMSAGNDKRQEINSGLNYLGDEVNLLARANYNNASNSSYYGVQLDSIQVVSKNGIDFINPSKYNDYNSYISVNNKLEDNVRLKISSDTNGSDVFINDSRTAIGVESYERYSISARTKNGDYVFSNGLDRMNRKIDLVPGKSLSLSSSLKKIVENIILVSGEVDSLRCEGESCVSVQLIQDNLYRLRTFDNQSISLLGNGLICSELSETQRTGSKQNILRINCENP
ncbi:MAG: TcfC E-set like domain-containing protein [Shewanella sp.]